MGYLGPHLVTILGCLRRCLFCNDVLWTFDRNAKGKRKSQRLRPPILAEYLPRLYAIVFGRMVGKLFDCYAAPFGVAIESSRTQTIVTSFGSHVFSGTASPLAEALLF